MIKPFSVLPSLNISSITLRPNRTTLTVTWPFAAIILAHILWGGNFLVAKIALNEFPTMTLAFLRFCLAILLLLPFLLANSTGDKKISRKDLPLVLLTGVLMTTFNIAFFYEGLKRTTVTDATVLTMSIPFLSVWVGWWFLKEKVYLINLAGIFIGLIGILFIIGLPHIILGRFYDPNELLGNILIMISNISWVAGASISKRLVKKYSVLTITAFLFLVGVVSFFMPAAKDYIDNPAWIEQLTGVGILGLVYIAVASSVSAYFLFEWALSRLGIIKVGLFEYIEPIIATALAILILSEKIELSFIIGAILIGLGAYWGSIAQHVHNKAHRK